MLVKRHGSHDQHQARSTVAKVSRRRGPHARRTNDAREHAALVRQRHQLISSSVRRDKDVGRDQEGTAGVRDNTLCVRAATDAARNARERLLLQLREANEQLVLATLRADELLAQAVTARALAVEDASVAAEARRRAESQARQLVASENALRASETQAHATNRAKDEFLAMLGHELRNPLAPILLALDLIAMDSEDTHQREHAIIDRQVKQLVRLVDDLLDVSRIESGKISLRREPLELSDAVSRAVEIASPLIEAKQHTLTVKIPMHGLSVDGDLLRLTQVVANLLTNAAKYTPTGGTIEVTGERRGTRAVLRVRDSGIGITAEMLPRVFELFAQEQQPSDRAPGGLGLGLSIVRSLISLHDGTVIARSEGLGRGSEFEIELPVGSPHRDPTTTSADTINRVTARKILVVDDNKPAAELTGTALRKLGHDVRIAFDGPSALEIARDFTPDVALLDIGLPGMDGYELARRLHDIFSAAKIRYVAVTGYGQDSDRQRSMGAGFDAHLVKPVDITTLQRNIECLPSVR
jgi:signal transduction histidine kinase